MLVKKILLIKTSSLGDLIHTIPAINDMQHHCPDVELHWLVEEDFANVPLWHPFIKRVHCCAIRRWRQSIFSKVTRGEIKQLKRQLLAEDYALVIDAQGLLKTAFMTRWFKGINAGYDKHSIKESLASYFYQQKVAIEFKQPAIIRVRQLFATLLAYDINNKSVQFGMQIRNPATALIKSVVGVNQDYMIFLHGTNWSSKLWPESYWCELASRVSQKGLQILIPWGDETERLRAERIAAHVNNNAINVLPKCSLDELAYLLQNAKAVVGMDTGLSHIGASLAIPIVGVYGSTNSGLTGLRGEQATNLQSGKDCSPCMKRECSLIKQGELIPCYQDVGVDAVMAELDYFLNKHGNEIK